MTPLEAVLVLAAGLAAGTINAIIGSGTLITFPVLLAVGYPPVVANVTNTVGLVPGSVSAVWAYRHVFAGHGRRTARLAAASTCGGVIGAVLVLVLDEALFETVVPWLIGGALVLIVAQPRLSAALTTRRDAGAARRASPAREAGPFVLLALAAAGIYGGYFGAGQGIMLFAILATALPDDLQRVNGTRNLLAGCVNGVAAVVFLFSGDVAYGAAALIALGAIAGGLLGAGIGQRLSPKALRATIVLVGLAAMIGLIT